MSNIGSEISSQISLGNCDKDALIEVKTGLSFTFNDLNNRINFYAKDLVDRGVKPGMKVILMLKPSADFICLTFSLFKIGAPVILIDPGMGYKKLLKCVGNIKPDVFIGVPAACIFRRIFVPVFKTIKITFCVGKTYGFLGKRIKFISGAKTLDFPTRKVSEDELAAIIFTTGSTGPPKGVQYNHSVFYAQLQLIRNYYKISSRDIDQPAFPLFALFSTALGACAVIPNMNPAKPAKVNPKEFISSIISNNVSYSFGSPALWEVVSNYCLENDIVLDSVDSILMAGAPVSGDLIKKVSGIIPKDSVINIPYGATESLPIVSITGKEVLKETWQRTKLGLGTCVGKSLPGIEIKIIKPEDGEINNINDIVELETGQIGEIIVKGPVVTTGYENNQAETRLSKIIDKKSLWHRMGDMGYVDINQRLWFCGRKAHMVLTKKETLYTIPCEAIINEHPDVRRSALVGLTLADNSGHQIPVMIVEPTSKNLPNKNELLCEVRELAATSMLTNSIQYFLIHNNFPVDIRHNAKIFREKLAEWAMTKL